MTLIDQINDLVGDRLTADKAACIAERDGYKVTGVVMTRVAQESDDFTGVQRCIVNLGGVRWFHDAQRWHDEIMFPEGRPKLAEVIAQRDELLAALEEIANDYADRFDLESSSTNPGIKYVVEQARSAIASVKGGAA